MSERSQSPAAEFQNRPYNFSRANTCPQALGQESYHIPPGFLTDPNLLYNKSTYGGISSASAPQTLFPFPPMGADYRGSDQQQAADLAQPKRWYAFAAPEYMGQVPGTATATQPTNLSPPIAQTPQIKLPEIKVEKECGEDYSAELKLQQLPTHPTVSHGVFYSAPWNPTFWPGIPHLPPPGSSNPNPSTSSASSPSMSPSPPSSGLAFFGGTSTESGSVSQNQPPSSRSSGSSSGGCSDSEEVRRTLR